MTKYYFIGSLPHHLLSFLEHHRAWENSEKGFSYDTVWTYEICRVLEASISKTTARICTIVSIVSKHEISSVFWYCKLWDTTEICRGIGFFEIVLGIEGTVLVWSCTNIDFSVFDRDMLSRQSDDSFDKWKWSIGGDKDDDVVSFIWCEIWRNFVYHDEVFVWEGWTHTLSRDAIWIDDKKSYGKNNSYDKHQKCYDVKDIKKNYFSIKLHVLHCVILKEERCCVLICCVTYEGHDDEPYMCHFRVDGNPRMKRWIPAFAEMTDLVFHHSIIQPKVIHYIVILICLRKMWMISGYFQEFSILFKVLIKGGNSIYFTLFDQELPLRWFDSNDPLILW